MIVWRRIICWYCSSDRCGHDGCDVDYYPGGFFVALARAVWARHVAVCRGER